jgi:hypothetical protein
MENKSLVPRKIVESEGSIHYSESFQAWNTLKLKKDLLLEFPQLKEKRSKFSYRLCYYRDIKQLEEGLKEIISGKNSKGTPFLLWLCKEE